MPFSTALKLIKLWPPYLGAGIKVKSFSDDYSELTVEMNQTVLNSNYVGVHFGGSLYSMCDPFYMLMMMQLLGRDYIVWDKESTIKFIRPGKGRVHATFKLSKELVAKVKAQADGGDKVLPTFDVYIYNEQGEEVALVTKTLYVKKKS